MKTHPIRPLELRIPGLQPPSGFALIITISLMVLLSLLAVGLLALSSVTLRGSNSGDAMREARSNAKLALELAIGQLQKEAGPDTRITASANLVQSSAPRGITGVWQASTRNELAQSPPDKTDRFVAWLTSDSMRTLSQDSAHWEPVSEEDDAVVPLFGAHSLGENPTADEKREQMFSRPLELGSDSHRGRLAWVTVDESTKARFDLLDDHSTSTQESLARRVCRSAAPRRVGVFALDSLENLRPNAAMVSKFATFESAIFGTQIEKLRTYRPDLTPWSLSLMTNPVDGGLKTDLSTLISENPTELESDGSLYAYAGLPSHRSSDPEMSTLAAYHELYKEIGKSNAFTRTVRSDAVGASLPGNLRPYTVRGGRYVTNAQVPDGMVLLPNLVRVDMVFSLVARDPHTGSWADSHKALGNNYMLHLMYLPVVTLHNPYNIPLSFQSMKITFQDVPIGFKMLVGGRPATTDLVPLNNMYIDFQNSNTSKQFGINLKRSLTGGAAMTLEPGQTKIFGTIGVNPSWNWNSELGNNRLLFDWENKNTGDVDLLPKMMTDSTGGAGFDIDWLAQESRQTSFAKYFCARGTVGAKKNDIVSVEWGPVRQPSSEFSIIMELNGRPAGIYKINYGDEKNLTDIVSEGTSERFPDPRSFPFSSPESSSPKWRASSIYEAPNTPFNQYSRAVPFALFSFSGKTTQDSFVPARPYADSSTNLFVADLNISRGKGAAGDQPFELAMVPIKAQTAPIAENREDEEGFFFGGNDSDRGTSRATFNEIPRAPLQSLAQFRHANLANSGTPPFMTYTVGESWAHPMLPTDEVTGTDPGGSGEILDHTYLCNAALWDRYFFSTMADYEGDAFSGTSKSAAEVREEFFAGDDVLLNPRFTSLVHGHEADQAASKIAAPGGDQEVARYLGLKGGFNVNSTSVDAWIAMLSSLRDTEVLNQVDGAIESQTYSPFLRVRYPSAGPIEGAGSSFFGENEPRWQGYRQLDESEIKSLAENLVDEIRERGPFLSLAEFVNRRLGPSNDETALRGALSSAIQKADLNAVIEGDGIELEAGNLGTHQWVTPAAVIGTNTEGAPGSLTQGDILTSLGSQLTVRGDTFVIRAYGESTSKRGQPEARAWCEAVVQRTPEFTDLRDAADSAPDALNPVNSRFGRHFEVLSFRWLVSDEI
ncbi:hypothetical protein HNR46_000941 [Haloferula luteola]|uniref:Verru_Chthon cassette protein A n=1 Tax=Haloferula luteola TaxID=595692 RepID=A0A840V098_9BACT|nr:hypothetical protein [Haloferula luteola]MBB5350713.1 hypothetical protein [Haloferula luteola]